MIHRRGTKRPVVLLTAVLLLCLPLGVRVWMHISARGRIHDSPTAAPPRQVALVLGAGVRADGTLSPLLRDRVDTAITLYHSDRARKQLMSGDNRVSHYNEPERMRDYAVARGVPAADISCDYAGRRTYDSVYRARHVFGLREVLVVTQGFHLDRAIFLCDRLGLKAHGVSGRKTNLRASAREIPACLGALLDVYVRRPRQVTGAAERI